jgi:hypothetical protein
MKFYKEKNNSVYFDKIENNKLTAIYINDYEIMFLKNNRLHNHKNFAIFFDSDRYSFCLDGIIYGDQNDFTKQSWRRFVKLKAFL